jgi:hypothetical protein
MKIGQVISFLEQTKTREGDIELQSVTGFWVRAIPSTGERVVVCSVGDGQSLEDVLRRAKVEP